MGYVDDHSPEEDCLYASGNYTINTMFLLRVMKFHQLDNISRVCIRNLSGGHLQQLVLNYKS